MNKKISLTLILLLALVGIINSQDDDSKKRKQLPSIALGVGVLTYDGDLGDGVNLTSLSRTKAGINLAIEQRIGSIIGVSVSGIFGKLADRESGAKRNINFESKITQLDLNFVLHLDNDFLFKRTSIFAPYLFAGFGYLKFDSYSDLKDKNGITYNYWADGTIRDLPDSSIGSKIIRRDYTYESKLNDSAKYTNSTFAIPLGLGINLKITENLYVNLNACYHLILSDWIDNFKSGSNDRYLFANVAIQYNIGKPYDDSNPVYKAVDFSSIDNLDSDGDGVKDGSDICPGTPKGVKITPNGCPEDADEDGIFDYQDKEPLTKKGSFVDKNGVTITDKMIADRQKSFSGQATERSKLFYENPSLKYLKEVEAKSKIARKNNPKSAIVIPFAIKSADRDNDGYITTEEIGKAIDSFFEGESDFSVEKINELIDFFFEQ